MTDWLLPFLCGLGASIISAWGVGGGTLLLLVMTLFLNVDQRTAQGINLLFFLPTAISALICHAKSGYLDKPTLKSAVPIAVVAALLGAWVATNLDVEILRKPFGVYPRTVKAPMGFPHGRFSIESQTHSYSRKTTSIRCPSRHKTTGNSSPT